MCTHTRNLTCLSLLAMLHTVPIEREIQTYNYIYILVYDTDHQLQPMFLLVLLIHEDDTQSNLSNQNLLLSGKTLSDIYTQCSLVN